MSAPDVTLLPARPADRVAIDRMMQLYTHDFSEFWAGLPRGELPDDALFPAYPLDPYFPGDAANRAFLIRVGGHLAGFVLVNATTKSGQLAAHNMAEFFVVRKHRSTGVGGIATRLLFDRYPGQWEIAVARRNVRATAFWRRAAEAAAADGINTIDLDAPHWNGPIFRFQVASKA